jgi:hypothetical protein
VDEPLDSATFRMVVMCLGLALAIAIAGIAVIVGFGRQETGSRTLYRSGESTYWQAHRPPSPTPSDGTHNPNSFGRAAISREVSRPAPVPENLWLVVAALFGILVGLLIPTPRLKWAAPEIIGAIAFAVAVVLFAVLGHLGTAKTDGILVAVIAGLLGVLIPSPARYDLA